MEDRDGHLWLARYYSTLTRFDGRHFTDFTTVDGLGNNGVIDIFEDNSGTLWVSTNGGGISRYDGGHFTQFTTEEGLAFSLVFSIAEDRQGTIWAGTGKGLSRYDGQTWQTFDSGDGLASDAVFSIAPDSEDVLWFGNIGVSYRKQGQITALTLDDDLAKRRVNVVYSDRRGHRWFGTPFGAYRYDGKSIEKLTVADGLAGNDVRAFAEDRSGYLWVGTYDGSGLCRFDGDKWQTFGIENGMASSSVWSILRDSSGNLWFGTENGGVSRYDGETFTHFSKDDGLAGNFILSMVEDHLGRLWFATFGGGVSHYDGQVFQTLSRQDGLVSDAVQEIIEDRQGRLWFATEGGITRYRPSRINPDIEITQVLADRLYAPESEIELSSEQEFVQVSFRGRSLTTRNERLAYLYRLQGYQSEWQQTRHTQVEYGRLPPGEYEFQVKAVDRDLNYSEQPAPIGIVVRYPYGRLALWLGLGLALVGLATTGAYALNKRRQQLLAERALLQEFEDELQTARQLQMNLMPTAPPRISGLDIAGRCEMVNHVGGDFFQYFTDEDKLALCLADVTGHAMEAAVPVMMFSGVLKTEMGYDHSVVHLFSKLNATMHSSLGRRTFICFQLGEVNLTTRRLELANSGCPYPFHYRASTGDLSELQVDAYPLGVRAETTYSAIEVSLEEGDYIVFCSDGIVEAVNTDEQMFGFEQTATTIHSGCADALSAEQLIDYLLDAVQKFAGDVSQGHDMTCVVLRIKNE